METMRSKSFQRLKVKALKNQKEKRPENIKYLIANGLILFMILYYIARLSVAHEFGILFIAAYLAGVATGVVTTTIYKFSFTDMGYIGHLKKQDITAELRNPNNDFSNEEIIYLLRWLKHLEKRDKKLEH